MKKCNQKSVDQIKATIQKKYSYIKDDEIDSTYNLALGDYIRLRYPSMNNTRDPNAITLDFATSQWIIARMIDIIERAGASNVTSYKENGLSFTYATSYINEELRRQIMPRVGVPK